MADLEQRLLDWYAVEGRDLPWRRTRDPYAILVSEVMLQQTQVERVVPRYLRWLERWPTAESLAAAPRSEVIREWQGLGYNRRAVNLHRAAERIAEAGWPDDLTELAGVGRYTADAVARFAMEADVLPVDVNVAPRPRAHAKAASGPPRRTRSWTSARRSASPAFPGAALARSRRSARRAAGATSRCASRAGSRARSGSFARRRCGSSPSGRALLRIWMVKRSPR